MQRHVRHHGVLVLPWPWGPMFSPPSAQALAREPRRKQGSCYCTKRKEESDPDKSSPWSGETDKELNGRLLRHTSLSRAFAKVPCTPVGSLEPNFGSSPGSLGVTVHENAWFRGPASRRGSPPLVHSANKHHTRWHWLSLVYTSLLYPTLLTPLARTRDSSFAGQAEGIYVSEQQVDNAEDPPACATCRKSVEKHPNVHLHVDSAATFRAPRPSRLPQSFCPYYPPAITSRSKSTTGFLPFQSKQPYVERKEGFICARSG